MTPKQRGTEVSGSIYSEPKKLESQVENEAPEWLRTNDLDWTLPSLCPNREVGSYSIHANLLGNSWSMEPHFLYRFIYTHSIWIWYL